MSLHDDPAPPPGAHNDPALVKLASADEASLRLLAAVAQNLDLTTYDELADFGARLFGNLNPLVRRLRAEESTL